MRALPFVVLLVTGTAMPVSAQLAARQEPAEKILVLPFQASSADSAASIALADAVRDRVTAQTKGKVLVVPKAKLCEALSASGFPCNGLLDDQQARQLARFLQVHGYITGSLQAQGSQFTANVRLIDMGAGIPASFTVTNGTSPAALADAIAQRAAAVIRASEAVRDCDNERRKGQFARARAAAQKALAADPTSTGAHLCLATVYEAQRGAGAIDSMVVESQRALAGDSLNATAWENIARGYQQKGDTLKAVDAFIQQLRGEPRNTPKRLGIAQLLRQMKQPERAVALLNEGLAVIPGDPQMLELKLTICTEASNYPCANEVWKEKLARDTAVLGDTTFLKPAIGAAQLVSDTVALLTYTAGAYRHFPNNATYIRARAGAFEMAGQSDSAFAYYRKALAIEPNDVGTSLQIAKTIVDGAVWDTTGARDTIAVKPRRAAFVAHVDSARMFLRPGLTSPDSTQRLAASVIMLTGGSKLAQAGAYDAAYAWLDSLLKVVAPRSSSDTIGPKQQIRINASFWYGLSSVLTLNKPYQDMTKAKGPTRCTEARAVFDRLTRTKNALQLGRRVHPPTADQMLGFVAQYERAKPQVQRAFKCSPALN